MYFVRLDKTNMLSWTPQANKIHKNRITTRGCYFINLINIMITGEMQNSYFTQYHYLTEVFQSAFN